MVKNNLRAVQLQGGRLLFCELQARNETPSLFIQGLEFVCFPQLNFKFVLRYCQRNF